MAPWPQIRCKYTLFSLYFNNNIKKNVASFYIEMQNTPRLVLSFTFPFSEYLFTKWERMIVRSFFLPYICSRNKKLKKLWEVKEVKRR